MTTSILSAADFQYLCTRSPDGDDMVTRPTCHHEHDDVPRVTAECVLSTATGDESWVAFSDAVRIADLLGQYAAAASAGDEQPRRYWPISCDVTWVTPQPHTVGSRLLGHATAAWWSDETVDSTVVLATPQMFAPVATIKLVHRALTPVTYAAFVRPDTGPMLTQHEEGAPRPDDVYAALRERMP